MLLIPLTHLLDGILLLVAVGRVEFLAELMRFACLTHRKPQASVPARQQHARRESKQQQKCTARRQAGTQTGRHAGSSSRRAAGRCQRLFTEVRAAPELRRRGRKQRNKQLERHYENGRRLHQRRGRESAGSPEPEKGTPSAGNPTAPSVSAGIYVGCRRSAVETRDPTTDPPESTKLHPTVGT